MSAMHAHFDRACCWYLTKRQTTFVRESVHVPLFSSQLILVAYCWCNLRTQLSGPLTEAFGRNFNFRGGINYSLG